MSNTLSIVAQPHPILLILLYKRNKVFISKIDKRYSATAAYSNMPHYTSSDKVLTAAFPLCTCAYKLDLERRHFFAQKSTASTVFVVGRLAAFVAL